MLNVTLSGTMSTLSRNQHHQKAIDHAIKGSVHGSQWCPMGMITYMLLFLCLTLKSVHIISTGHQQR